MLGALSQRHGEYRCGQYLNRQASLNDGVIRDMFMTAPFFTYEVVSNEKVQYSQILQNLITSEQSVIIETNYELDWQTRGYVKLQNDKLYYINNIEKKEQDINPQSYGIMKSGCDTIYYIELIMNDENEAK